jgi:dTDP-4-dehydrorhamnose reductase
MTGQTSRRILILGPDSTITFAGRAKVDLAQTGVVAACIRDQRPHLIINAAAYTAVDKAESEPELAHRINGDAVGEMAVAAHELGAAIIHISTDYVFNGSKTGAYLENDAADPQSVYGHSKALGEKLLRARAAHHVILRTSWVFSATGANFVKTMVRLGAERTEMGVVADQHGRPTYAPDLAQWIGVIGQRLLADQGSIGTYHAANHAPTTWADFAAAIFEGARARGAKVPERLNRISTADYPTPARRPANSVLSTTALERDYDLTIRSWVPALADCLDLLLPKG